MPENPTRMPQDMPTPHVPRRPEREADPLPPAQEPPTKHADWMNLHQTVAPSSKPAEPSVQRPRETNTDSGYALSDPSLSSGDSASATDFLPKMVGPYEIVRPLGRGGMGIVYLARDSRLKRPVALKMILTGAYTERDQRGRFIAEAQAVAQLKHPNIVQIYEIGEYQGHPYLALEYFDGGNMRQVCQGQPQEPRWSAQVVKTLAEAMEYAHNRGVIHRDLKPANILLQKDDNNTKNRQLRWGQRFPASSYVRHSSVKITDFGLAKFINEGEQAQEPDWKLYEYSGDAIGTPQYMAPEQAQGERGRVGPAADLYSIGAILYELLTGRPPFDGPTARDTILRVLTEEVLPPSRLQPRLPPDLETICLKCLQKDQAKRYASASDLVADLRRFLTGEPIHARRTIFLAKGVRWAKRRPLLAGLTAGMMVLFLAALAIISIALWGLSHYADELSKALVAKNQERDRATEERQEAQMQRAEAQSALEQERHRRRQAEHKLYSSLLHQAAALKRGDPQRAELLRRCDPKQGEFTEDCRGWEWYALK